MTNYSITTDHAANANYLVVLEDQFGLVPLFAIDSFDEAHSILAGLNQQANAAEPFCFSDQTERLMGVV